MKALTSRQWAAPVVGLLRQQEGAKFITLVRSLNANQPAIRQTLDYLIELGWVKPNPGYGHPMRPEYILTSEGYEVALLAERLWSLPPELLRKWRLPLIGVLDRPRRFSDLRDLLRGITERALSQSIKVCQEAGLVDRTILETFPPTALYRRTPAGEEFWKQVSGE